MSVVLYNTCGRDRCYVRTLLRLPFGFALEWRHHVLTNDETTYDPFGVPTYRGASRPCNYKRLVITRHSK
jgi:hypothetical protein